MCHLILPAAALDGARLNEAKPKPLNSEPHFKDMAAMGGCN